MATSSAAKPSMREGGAVNNGSFSSHINASVVGDTGLCDVPSGRSLDEAAWSPLIFSTSRSSTLFNSCEASSEARVSLTLAVSSGIEFLAAKKDTYIQRIISGERTGQHAASVKECHALLSCYWWQQHTQKVILSFGGNNNEKFAQFFDGIGLHNACQ